jgi:hypothetical protein
VFLFFALFSLISTLGISCSCAEPLPGTSEENQVLQELKDADTVFLGTVLSIWPTPTLEKRVTLLVHKSWRGKGSEKVVVRTGLGGGDCGFRFKRGEKYLVYAYVHEGRLSTHICSRTTNVVYAAFDLKILGTPLYEPKISSLNSVQVKFPVLLPLTTFFALALFILFLYRLYHRLKQT